MHRQESMLILDNERGAWLSDIKTSEKTFAGYFRPVVDTVALKQDAWTFCDGQYFVIEDVLLGGKLQR